MKYQEQADRTAAGLIARYGHQDAYALALENAKAARVMGHRKLWSRWLRLSDQIFDKWNRAIA